MPVVRYILKGHLYGQVAIRNMFYASTNLAEGSEPMDTAQGYLNGIIVPLRPYMGSSWVLESVEIQHLDADKWYTDDEASYSYVGTGSGDMLPNAVAVVLVAKVAGTFLHGKKFFSGVVESASTANQLVSGAAIAFAQAALAWVSPYTDTHGGVVTPGIVDKYFVFRSFTNGWVSTLLGSMRRRKPGIGI